MRKKRKKIVLLIISIVASLVVLAGILLLCRTFQISASSLFDKSNSTTFPDKRVLFITSFNDEVPSVSSQKKGLLSVFDPADVWLDVISMNSRDYPDEENARLFHQLLEYRIKHHNKYDAIIAGDDEALYYVESHLEDLFAETPVYFIGIGDIDHAHRAVENPLITGSIEHLYLEKTVKVAMEQNPDAKTIVAIHDSSITGKTDLEQFMSLKMSFPEMTFESVSTSDLTRYEFEKEIRSLDKSSILLCLSGYDDADGNHYNAYELCEMVSNCSQIPVYTTISECIGHGFAGGLVLDMEAYGRQAGQTIRSIFSGKSPKNIELYTKSMNRFCFDYKILKKYNLKKSVLPIGTVWINRYSLFWMENGMLIISLIMILSGVAAILLTVGLERHLSRIMQSELSSSHQQLKYMIDHDFMTGLPKIQTAHQTISELLESGRRFSVLKINISNFRSINDAYTHACGDFILTKIGHLLLDMENDDYCIARDNSEFIIIYLKGYLSDVSTHFDYIKQTFLSIPVTFNGVTFTVNTKFGIFNVPVESKLSVDEVMTSVDYALLNAKTGGKSNYVFFTKEMGDEIRNTKEIVRILEDACKQDGFVPFFQPQIDAITGEIFGYESLCRLKDHPISPALFIPIAENNGFITKIGRIMTEKVIKQMASMRDEGIPLRRFAINYSAGQIVDTGYVDFLRGLLEKYNIPPEMIEIEITESLFLGNDQDSAKLFKQLDELGVSLALDDFGTGYSSISYLAYLPVGVVKIDKTMVDVYLHDGKDVLIQNIINMVHSLGMKLIAEGIEEKWQYEKLKTFDCDVIQGYYFSKPIPGSEVKKYNVS
ncbi:MAG: EAL domain-containing protein [Treponema sp.]|nr:EAL domain-containing protein [Treponema sp.]